MGNEQSKSIRDLEGVINYHMEEGVSLKQDSELMDSLFHFEEAYATCQRLLELTQYDDDVEEKVKLKMKECRRQIQSLNDKINSREKRRQIQIQIQHGDVGHTYETLFSNYLDQSVSQVIVQDPYIQKHFQIVYFLRFCELLVKNCPNLKKIQLLTKVNYDEKENQASKLAEIKKSLEQRRIRLSLSYSDTLHDRAIILDSGWIFKIGRGLDFYQSSYGQLSIGVMDLSLRKCMETTIDIFSIKDVEKCFTKRS